MRIALVHMRHAHAGGTERYLNQVAEFLARRGDEVTIVCRSHEDAPHAAVRFHVLRPFAIGATWRMTSFARAVEAHVRGAGYDVVYGLGKTWTHDVVRLGGGCQATYVELAAHGDRAKDRAALDIEARALAPDAFRLVVVNSNMVGADVQRRHRVPPEKVRLVYNGVDLERFHPRLRPTLGAELRRSLAFGERDLVVLFLGSGYARKGLAVAIEAFSGLARAKPEARLLVAGYDSTQAEYERLAARAGVADRVRFLGGRRDTEACYAAADLYVLPTRYDPFANTTLEALASGLPAITTRTNGASELLQDDVNGSVLDSPCDPAALERALLGWSFPARLREGSLAARALAERHSAESKARESAAALDEVAAARSRA